MPTLGRPTSAMRPERVVAGSARAGGLALGVGGGRRSSGGSGLVAQHADRLRRTSRRHGSALSAGLRPGDEVPRDEPTPRSRRLRADAAPTPLRHQPPLARRGGAGPRSRSPRPSRRSSSSCCPPLTKSGLWDPYELNVADLSRRIALNLYGAGSLALEGADNSLPHLNDLGRPQLPFSSIALGFKLFGLHEWAGRLPLALWGLLGRARDLRVRRAPLRPAHGRLRGGRAVDDAALLRAGAHDARRRVHDGGAGDGVRRPRGGGVRPRREGARRPRWRGCRGCSMAALGLFVGFESRGGLLGLGVPARRRPGVGRARVAREAARPTASATRSAACRSLVGVAVGGDGGARHRDAGRHQGPQPVGRARCTSPSKYPTFDYYVGAIGHALAPWSAFLPFALRPPAARAARPDGARGRAREPGARRRCSSAPPWRSSRTRTSSPGPTSWPSAARRSAPWPAPSRSGTSSAGRTRRSPWASARCCSRPSSTTTSTSCPRRPTRPSASPGRRSRKLQGHGARPVVGRARRLRR